MRSPLVHTALLAHLCLSGLGCGAAQSAAAPTPEVATPEVATSEPETAPESVPESEDADRDAVPDGSDACPHEAEVYNATDDEDGCPDCAGHITLDSAWSLPTFRFRARSTAIARPWNLDFSAAVIQAHTEYAHVDIVGSVGAREPASLALERAEAVRAGLLARGVSAERLSVSAARGEASVTFHITYSGSAYPLCNTPFPGCAPDDVFHFIPFAYSFPRRSAAMAPVDGAQERAAVLDFLHEATEFVSVDVVGYTVPGEPHAHELALQRAEAVIAHLVASGIARERLFAIDGGDIDEPTPMVNFERLGTVACAGIHTP